MTAGLPLRPTYTACRSCTASPILLHPGLITVFRVVATRVLSRMEVPSTLVFIAGHPSKYWSHSLALNQPTVPVLLKENTPSRVVRGERSFAGIRRRIPTPDASKWSPDSHHPTSGCFSSYRTYLWNKQQVMSINLTAWSTMQYHVIVNHVVFYVIHSQVRYKTTTPLELTRYDHLSHKRRN